MEALLKVKPARAEHEPKGNCWDNAVAESFFSSLKKERIKKHIYKTRTLATEDISDYIETSTIDLDGTRIRRTQS